MKRLLFLSFCLLSLSGWATHNRAGEITYRWISGTTYEARITTYTRSCALCADRCELTINWGDGNRDLLPRSNGISSRCAPNANDGEIIDPVNEIRKNVYIGRHTYNAGGTYTISFEDANRNAGINNIINSDQIPFYVQTEIFIGASSGTNSSPILLNPPVERGCINRRFEHNAGAFDPDGDSLSYRLVPSRTTNGDPIPTIYDRTYVQDSVEIDPETGTLIWDVPQTPGQFNFAFEISEWREGRNGRMIKIGTVTRDLQVDIEDCGNNPPVIDPVGPFCIEAGRVLRFDVRASDPDDDPLNLTAFGGPFAVKDSADNFDFSGPSPLTGTFRWPTSCRHVRKQPYQVTFKAEDEPADQFETPLADLLTVEILVIAPAPENPSASGQPDQINLRWNLSPCAGASGYKIYRRESRFGFIPDSCELDVPAYTGYELIDSNTAGEFDTTYADDFDLELGVEYCYMVVAYFDDGAVSYASEEFCASLPLSLPLMTQVDIDSTSSTAGAVEVDWIAPPELDSNFFPPPYRYVLYRAEEIDGLNYQPIANFNGLNTTGFRDVNLNTEARGYRYRVELFSGPGEDTVGFSNEASSIFLQATGSDQSVELEMRNLTPWQNDRFVIYREIPTGSGNFDSVAQSFGPEYRDTGLINGENYCYYVESYGRYTASDSLPAPLINRSQITCAVAQDTVSPCTPAFQVRTVCPDTVYFSWQFPGDCRNDASQVNIYFKPSGGSFSPEPVFTFRTNRDSTVKFVNDGDLFGCYAISAQDDAGQDPGGTDNESPRSEEVCLSSCFEIRFPNVFTPNADGINDFFLPIEYNQVADLRIDIYNRWGTKIYSANSLESFVNPGWDGTVSLTGEQAAEGVYYYICRYTPKAIDEVREQEVSGFVHLFR